MDEKHKALLEKQHYNIIGSYSAVKLCTWTKKSMRDLGVCYKERFYGIRCHLCCQISTTIGFCQNSCIFCWRPMEYTDGIEMKECDEPEKIVQGAIEGQRKLLSGFGGFEGTNREKLKLAQEPMHFAISLSGEPTIYPKLNELIRLLHSKGKTTFVVSNGMLPDRIKDMELPTQLYISVDAPNEELFKKIDNPSLQDGWQRLMKTLDILNGLKEKTRTTLRLTLIKGMNMTLPEEWAEKILRAQPMFVEVKAYMFVGFSQLRLKIENMPRHEEVKEFAEEICKHSGYSIIDEQPESRVVLLMKEDRPERIMKFD
ncbi:4-demethylwyosine synthase TYW1 [Candidatus Woesearchaeota archaeon]|nr:4-demethylwyosine synthase TYW1 [Candidatus Woesearchaeota archaeon]